MKSKYDSYLYFTDSFDKFLYKNVDSVIYIFDEIKYNFDIKFANYACNSNSIEYRKQIRATNDLEAYYVFIEYLFDYHKSNISFVREQLSKLEKIERDINLKKYVYEEEIDFQNNYNYIVNFSYFNTIIRVIYHNNILHFQYSFRDDKQTKRIIPDCDKVIEHYKETVKRDIEHQNRAIERNKKDLRAISIRRNKFKDLFPEFYM